jgi:mono/diheme cytochrome c family protein
VLLALTGYQIGLLCSAIAFIAFALLVALVVPRVRPEFPGRYLGWFIAAAILFFAGQMTAVLLLANLGESEASAETHAPQTATSPIPPTTSVSPPAGGTTTGQTTTGTTTTGTTTTGETTTTGSTTTSAAGGQGDPAAGKTLFASEPCGGCHTLADAGTSGTVGPNLDDLKPSFEAVQQQVTNGGGAMPPFKDQLTPQQIDDIAAYVSSVAGK